MHPKIDPIRFVLVLGAGALIYCPSAVAQTGACCLSPPGHIDCVEMTEADCALAGGTYGGDGSICATESTVTTHFTSSSTDLFVLPVVGCQDVGTTGPTCLEGPLVDAFLTPPPGTGGATCHTFGSGPESPPIPPDFFGPGSDPFTGTVCFVGEPIGPTSLGDFGIADTIIRRAADPFDRCDLPEPTTAQVPIQIEELNLTSVQPITVTFQGQPTQWDVRVNLSDAGSPPGSITATKDNCNGGQFQAILPIQLKFTFTDVSSPTNVQVLDTGLQSIPPVELSNSPAPWVHVLDAGVSNQNQTCTDFHPGIDDPDPPASCVAPTEVRTTWHLANPSAELWLGPGVTCDPSGSGGPQCTPGVVIDPWTTTLPSPGVDTFVDFGAGPDLPPIPANFFDPGSDPFIGRIDLIGDPLGPTTFGDFGSADTLILRSADPFDRCSAPSNTDSTVDIEIVELSLTSIQPITVNVAGQPTEWNVRVTLSDGVTPPPGIVTATKSNCNGGAFDTQVYLQPRFTFINVDDPLQVRVWDTGQQVLPPLVLSATDAPWVSVLDPFFIPLGLACTDFHPGLDDLSASADCDCQTNGIMDACDLASGTSSDCNANETPDECDPRSPGDFDGNGLVNIYDYTAFAQCMGGPGTSPAGPPGCLDFCEEIFDQDSDLDIDLKDCAMLTQVFVPLGAAPEP